ncbi:hypothetical protein J2Z31_002377 [Sinorhizobium kostiense]|uniref:Transposase n=1 Tax=Sinorhizobium kostiense TaxID=76747 RepID=A0ABS4QZ12_9HYPH|nr:hypothetical protein [Sinorhizobium kostiense]
MPLILLPPPFPARGEKDMPQFKVLQRHLRLFLERAAL